MNKNDKKELINSVIKKLEKIRDTSEIDEIVVYPYEEVEEYKFLDGKQYVILQTTISLRYNNLFEKGDIDDTFLYKPIK